MDNFNFNPAEGFLNTSSYPDPASGTAARTQLQSLHTQTQTFINEQLVATINSMQSTINTLNQQLSTANTAISALQTQVNGFASLFTTSGLRLIVDGTTYAVTVVDGDVRASEVN